MHLKRFAYGLLSLLVLIPGAAFAGEGKISGESFGDVYWFAANHDSTLKNENGYWIRRIYLTYDYKTDDVISTRVRFDMSSPGNFTAATIVPSIKDAYVKMQKGNQALFAGMSPAPTLAVIEDFWGYRSLERVPDDLQGLGGSRDIGLAASGSFGTDHTLGYSVMVANGNGTKSETDKQKKEMAEIHVSPVAGLTLLAYGDYEDRVNDADRKMFHVFAGYKKDKFRAGAEYAKQVRNTVGPDVIQEVVSGFLVVNATDKVALVGRVDRNTKANPGGSGISYIPFDPTAPSTFILAALDCKVRSNFSVMPNIEAVTYSKPDGGGPTPDSDVIARLTMAWKF
jgi:hypothetical protein